MYSPFLWRIAKGQSRLIIKRRWWRCPSNACQIYMQGLKLHKHIHQKLTMSRLNGHDSVQHTLNARITWNRRWRINNGRWSTYSSAMGSPEEEGGGGATSEEDSIWGRLELALIWVALYWRKMTPMGAIMCTSSDVGN